MKLLKKEITVDTVTRSGEVFDLDMVVSFTVFNTGDTDCLIGYKGKPPLMKIEAETAREFPGDSGYTYYGEMQIRFKDSDSGSIEIVKSIASTKEH